VPSYNLLLKLLLKHKSHSQSSSLPKLLSYIIILINTSNIIRTKQTKHIKDKTKVITVAEGFKKALKAIVTLKTIAVSRKIKTIINITRYLYAKKSVIFITS
jgi:hypothetical protein